MFTINNTSAIQLSEEQLRFIETAKTGHNILVDACIGSGKTTVLQRLCDTLPDSCSILYLTYNRLLKVDAQSKIKNANTTVTNYHGFAAQVLHSIGVHTAMADLIQTFLKEKPTLKHYDLLLIDEYQDIEQELADMLEYIKSSNPQMQIIAVGDMQQKIYDKTELKADSFIHQFLGDYVSLKFTRCFRLSAGLAEFLGRIWHKEIIGVNDRCHVETMSREQVCTFLANQPVEDILCLGQRGYGDLSNTLNTLEDRYPEKFNKNTVFASIRDQDRGAVSPKDGSAIFTTYDSSKGMERKICVIFNFTESYWDYRMKMPQQSYEILRNVFCVACSRGKEHIIFVENEEAMLSEETLSAATESSGLAHFFSISEMFDYKYVENVNACYDLLDVHPIPSADRTIIPIPKHDAMIDLTPCIGKYQEVLFFKNYSIDTDIDLYYELHRNEKNLFTDQVRQSSAEEKVLFYTSLVTGQKRYRSQVKIPFIALDAKWALHRRLSTQLSPDERVQVRCTIDFAAEENGSTVFSAVGLADAVRDEVVYELKFVSALSHTHFLQCACYVVAMGLEKGILWNTFNNEQYEIRIPDRKAFLDAVAAAITKKEHLKYYAPADSSLNLAVPVTSQLPVSSAAEFVTEQHTITDSSYIAVIDTETNYSDQVMSIGIVIAEASKFKKVDESYYILSPESSIGGMFTSALPLKGENETTTCSREKAIAGIRAMLSHYHISHIFAYNASFDRNHLPELSDFNWYDIMKIAAYVQHNPYIPASAECCKSGRLRRNGGVEPMLRLLLRDSTYCETHNALYDAQDELKILQILDKPLEEYTCALLKNKPAQRKQKKLSTAEDVRKAQPFVNESLFAQQSHNAPPCPMSTYSQTLSPYQKSDSDPDQNRKDSSRNVYTTTEVSQMLNISPNQVYQLIRAEEIKAKKEKNRFYIDASSVENYLERKKKEQQKEKIVSPISWIVAIIAAVIISVLLYGM